MRPIRFVCLSVILLSTMVLAQSNPVPLINNPLVPTSAAPGGASFMLTVNGTGFVSGSVVNWNGSLLATDFVSGSQLTATVPASNIATAGTASVSVTNPAPGGGTSNTDFFDVRQPLSAVGLGKVSFPSVAVPYSPIAADLNGDGKLDVINLTSDLQTTEAVSVLLGNGNGAFQPQTSYPIEASFGQAVLGDFNNDGKLDLAATSTGFSVMLGNGDGTFQPYYQGHVLPEFGYGLTTGDFNEDGNLDVAVSAYDPVSDVFIVLGTGDGTFQSPITCQVSSNSEPGFIATGDFNGDGKLDLAVPLPDEGEVAVLLGNGDGSFQNPVTSPAVRLLTYILAADLNRDGKLDLVMAGGSLGNSNISVLLGNGDGTFPSHQEYPLIMVTGIVATDLNGDGNLDVVASSRNGTLANLGNGDGSLQNSVFSYAGSTLGVAAGDFNGDGKVDLAVTDEVHNANGKVVALLQSDLTLSPTLRNFHAVTVGQTKKATSILTNLGSASFQINNIGLTGADSANFGESDNCGKSIPPGASCTLTLTFKPQSRGSFTAIVQVSDSAVKGPQSIYLEGKGR